MWCLDQRPIVVVSFGNDVVSGPERLKARLESGPEGESVGEADGRDASGFRSTSPAVLADVFASRHRVVDRAAQRDDVRPLPKVVPANCYGSAVNTLLLRRRESPNFDTVL